MKRELVLITGMAGSGKSIALHALEDAGYYCVDNLPPELLMPFVQLEDRKQSTKVAIAMDVRSANALHTVPAQLAELRKQDVNVRLLFLDASPDTLLRRFSETRRNHPLSHASADGSQSALDLMKAIDMAREYTTDVVGFTKDEIIQSLNQPKMPVKFVCEMKKDYRKNDDGEPIGLPVHETNKPKTT
jgi:UPF0042 nucleotide-binding protein